MTTWSSIRKATYGLLAVAWLLAACASPQEPTTPPTPSVEGHEESRKTATPYREPSSTSAPSPTPTVALAPSPTPTATTPPGKALFRGIATYDRTRRFEVLYAVDRWRRDENELRHRAIPTCTLDLHPEPMGLEEEWVQTRDQVALDGWDFEQRAFSQEEKGVPEIISYGLPSDAPSFIFVVTAWHLEEAAFKRCRADAEAVLATFTPLEPFSGEFAATRAALDVYEPLLDPRELIDALTREGAAWLSRGGDPEELATRLRTLPGLGSADPAVTLSDLNGDARRDVVLQTHLAGLPVIAYVAQEDGDFRGLALPHSFEEPLLTTDSGIQVSEVTDDERPETVITYTVQGGSGWTELLYVFRCDDPGFCPLVFHADLLNWAGRSTWTLEPDPTQPARRQIVLTYPRLYSQGFDHKMVTHPLGRQIWRWDEQGNRFKLTEESVDLERSAGRPDSPVTAEDQLRWFTNEGEVAFRSREYETALQWYEDVLTLARSEAWSPQGDQPDWVGYAHFRRAEILALQGRPDEARPALQAVADDYADDLLGQLAAAFLEGYGDGDAPYAAARGVAAMPSEDLYEHLYHERGGALRFPMDASGILYPGAGLVAYLEGHPLPMTDMEELLAGLREIGFAAEEAQDARIGTTYTKMVIALRLPDAPNAEGHRALWILGGYAGNWRVLPPASEDDLPEWPSVGGFPTPALAPEYVTP